MERSILDAVQGILGLNEDELRENCRALPEIEAFYFWSSKRGGSAVIINARGERLIASSAVKFEDHKNAFLAGKRN